MVRFPLALPALDSPSWQSPVRAFAWGMRSVASTVLTLVLFATYLGIGALAHDTHFSLGWVLASTVLVIALGTRPLDRETAAAVFPPWWSQAAALTAASEAGAVTAVGALPFIVVVNAPGWEQALEENKRSYFNALVAGPRFAQLYPATMTGAEFVEALDRNAGRVLSPAERDSLSADLVTGAQSRAQVLRTLAENHGLRTREFNRAFVMMEYFGYLRRDPDGAPDWSFEGYNFWLDKLNQFDGDFVKAEMVRAFITSDEYRKRFGQ